MAFQLGLPRVINEDESRSSLRSLWKYNFTPDVGIYRSGMQSTIPAGRWYAMPGEAGLLMCTWPHGGAENAAGGGNPTFVGYFNECMTGFEYQVAAHMIWEGMVTEGLAITRAIHDRYAASKRNPYNEVECPDHYSRAMMSYGVYLAACGYEYHGPKGYISFAPRVSPKDFRAAFTAAEGWGTFAQKRTRNEQRETIDVKWGKLRLRTLAFTLPPQPLDHYHRLKSLRVSINHNDVDFSHRKENDRLFITLARNAILDEERRMVVVIR